jgi:DNA-3-methyladenine glycosylase II
MRKAILHLKKSDPVLASVIERVGPYRIEYREPGFETLVRSIVYQQISGKVAAAILGRLIGLMPRRKLTPKAVLTLTPEQMRGVGLSAQKAAYIRDLAVHTKARTVNFASVLDLPDESVIEHLTKVKGVGVWTAHMFLIFALRRPDVLPTGDLGVRMAIQKAYELEELPKARQIEEMAMAWRPYCSVATWYLWRSLDGPAEL